MQVLHLCSCSGFQHFNGTTYKFDHRAHFALSGVTGQFHRAVRLLNLARQIAPAMQKDHDELSAKGYSRGIHSAEFTAIVEAFFCGIYASVDCCRQIVAEIYRDFQGVTSKSTRRFFQNASDGILDPRLPVGIRDAFTNASWYHELRRIRDAVIHSDVGSCHMNDKTGKIFYMHSGLGTQNCAMITEDIVGKMEEAIKTVNIFLGKVFRDLNATLKDEPIFQICGVFGGRIYSRLVKPAEAVNFQSGICDSFHWFESPGNPICPLTESCGAYKRAKR